MKTRILLIIITLCSTVSTLKAQSKAFVYSVFLNQNVYATRQNFTLKKVYHICTDSAIAEDTTKYILITENGKEIMKYKELESGDNPYIRILPLLYFDHDSDKYGNKDTVYIRRWDSSEMDKKLKYKRLGGMNPSNYYFQVQNDMVPNNHYLFSQSIIGMPITMPLKMRKKEGKREFDLDYSLGYAFGWKVKVGRNPYHKKYINVIPLALSINKDNYFVKNSNSEFTEAKEGVSFTYYSFGITYDYYGFNFGLFTGWDRMMGDRSDWYFQKKQWLSFGIGYKFGKE